MGCTYTKPKEMKSKHFPGLVASLPSMEEKVVAITGTTSGTGFALAKMLVQKGAKVLLLNRPSDRADNALKELSSAGSGKPVAVPCDLMNFANVREAAALVKTECADTGLDVLVNNAGIMALEDKATVDGCDIQMQTNHLSHFLLTSELWPLLNKAAEAKGEARVVNHSSMSRLGPKLKAEYLGKNGGNLGGDKAGSAPFTGPRWDRYQQTKRANLVFTYAINERAKEKGSKVIALTAHPGVAATELQVKATKSGGMSGCLSKMAVSQSGEDGACGITICCCQPGVQANQFYGPSGMAGKAVLMPEAKEAKLADADSRKLLWEESEKTTGSKFDM